MVALDGQADWKTDLGSRTLLITHGTHGPYQAARVHDYARGGFCTYMHDWQSEPGQTDGLQQGKESIPSDCADRPPASTGRVSTPPDHGKSLAKGPLLRKAVPSRKKPWIGPARISVLPLKMAMSMHSTGPECHRTRTREGKQYEVKSCNPGLWEKR